MLCRKCENEVDNLMTAVMGGPERCEAEGHDRTDLKDDGSFWCGRCNTDFPAECCAACKVLL